VGGELSTLEEDIAGVELTGLSAFFGWYPAKQGLLMFELRSHTGITRPRAILPKTPLVLLISILLILATLISPLAVVYNRVKMKPILKSAQLILKII
jgi:hypothetical protein